MKVYRIELAADRTGPFSYGDYPSVWAYRYERQISPPGCHAPGEDPEDKDIMVRFRQRPGVQDRWMMFGCTTLDGLRTWFDAREWNTLETMGYIVVAYEADHVAEMSTQCLFTTRDVGEPIIQGLWLAA